MRNLILVLLLLAGSALCEEAAAMKVNYDAAFRLRYTRMENKEEVTGHGTAVAVDVAEWGYKGPHYLLTATHNVFDSEGHERGTLQIELSSGKWSKVDVVDANKDLDLCLLRSSKEVPVTAPKIADEDAKPHDHVWLLGSPKGVPIRQLPGMVMRRFSDGRIHSLMMVEFDHGCSGGPVFNKDEKIVGLAVQGVFEKNSKDQISHIMGLFVPAGVIRSFLDTLK